MSSVAHGKYSGRRLVIAGCGYVGAAVAEHAMAEGLEVTALTRNATTAAALRAGGIRAVQTDVAAVDWYDTVPAKPDFVLNCLSGGGAGLEGYRHSYLSGMESILRWLSQRGPAGTMVYTSSTSVYPHDGGVVVDEQCATERIGDTRPGILVAAEERLAAAGPARGRWFVLRLAGIYGPGRHHLLDQVRRGVVAGMGEHHLNLIHRDDVVSAIWSCFTAEAVVSDQVFNVADDAATRKSEITDWLAQQLQVPAPRYSGQPAPGRRAVTPDRIIANGKLKAVLGWAPRYPSYREGYRPILAR